MKRPNLFIWLTFGFIVKILALFKRQHIVKNHLNIKGPAITLSNHTSFFDFVYTTSVLYPKRTTYLAAKKMFYDPVLGFFLRLARAIPKALLEPDPVATMKTLKILKQGGIVSIFPEGQISASGVFLKPSFSIAKLIKKAGVPVYIIKHHNAYLVNPPWTKKTFAGRVDTIVSHLLSLQEVTSLSEELIYEKIITALYHNPFQYNAEKKYRYRLTTLDGLEKLIYQCPKCEEESLTIHQHTISCSHCGHTDHLDSRWQLKEMSLSDYYEKQREYLSKLLENDSDYSLSSPVLLQSFVDDKLVTVGQGMLSLSFLGYHYRGTNQEQNIELSFDSKFIPSCPSDIGLNIQIYRNGQVYQFEFSNPTLPTKFVLFGEILYSRKNKN